MINELNYKLIYGEKCLKFTASQIPFPGAGFGPTVPHGIIDGLSVIQELLRFFHLGSLIVGALFGFFSFLNAPHLDIAFSVFKNYRFN